jgi:hypothetical protein
MPASTINPLLPAPYTPVTAEPVRANFQAAINDINNIYSLLGGQAVLSVFGRTGNVAASSGDYNIAQITGVGALATLGAGSGLASDGTNLNVSGGISTRTIGFHCDGGSQAIVTGLKAFFFVPYACTITEWVLMADQTTNAKVDIWKAPFASFPPGSANSITGGALPTLTNAQSAKGTSLPTWTTAISTQDVLAFNVTSNASALKLDLMLKLQIS